MAPTIHTLDSGSGTPIVWIHGFPLSSKIFDRQLRIPAVRHVMIDLPGFGESPCAAIDSIDDYADVVLDTLDARGIDQAVIAGVSMGGYVAFSVLRKRPDLAKSLVLIDTREGPDTAEGRASRLEMIDRVGHEGTSGLIQEMLPKMLTKATVDMNDDRVAIVRQSMEAATSDGVIAALGAMASRSDSAQVLRDFDGPVLVAVGSDDAITPPEDARRMAGLATRSKVVEIAGAAHLSNVEQPGQFNAAMIGHLEDIS